MNKSPYYIQNNNENNFLFVMICHMPSVRKSWSSTEGPIGLAKPVLKFKLINTKVDN